jgi:hypothetical protein
MAILTDETIRKLLEERKPMPAHLQPLGTLGERNHHERKDFSITAASGNEFCVFVRKAVLNMLDFSVVLGYQLPDVHRVFRLRRYNGKAHLHTNVLERQTFYDFHVHTATERYQRPGFREEHFAEVTNRYHDLQGAIRCLIEDCGFLTPIEDSPLFIGKI